MICPREKRFTLSLSKGFTLLEVLVAIAVIMIAMASAFGLLPQGLVGARSAQNLIIANSFATEGFETVRNIRDSNMLFGSYNPGPDRWLGDLALCINSRCAVDPWWLKVIPCSPDGCPPIKYIDDGPFGDMGSYGNGVDYENGEATRFTRTVTLTRVPNTI